MTHQSSETVEQVWPEPPAHVYPHRYAYCTTCSRVVRDFQRDAVWRDREGRTLCMSGGSTFHSVASPPGATNGE